MTSGLSSYLGAKVNDHVLGNTAYSAPATVYVALFSSSTEVTGGSYARVAVTNNTTNWPNATVATPSVKSNGTTITFPTATLDWASGANIDEVRIYDASSGGNMLYYAEALGPRKAFTADASTDVLTSTSHGYTDGMSVEVEAENGSLCGGLSDNTKYYIRDSTTNTFKLAATMGGSAIDITSAGNGTLWIARTYKQPVLAGNQYSIAAGDLVINMS